MCTATYITWKRRRGKAEILYHILDIDDTWPVSRQELPNSRFYGKDSSKKARIGLKDAKFKGTGPFHALLKIEVLRFLPPMIIIYDIALHQACDLRYQALPFFACI